MKALEAFKKLSGKEKIISAWPWSWTGFRPSVLVKCSHGNDQSNIKNAPKRLKHSFSFRGCNLLRRDFHQISFHLDPLGAISNSSEAPEMKMQITPKRGEKIIYNFPRSLFVSRDAFEWRGPAAVMSNKLNEQLCFITVRPIPFPAFTIISPFTLCIKNRF